MRFWKFLNLVKSMIYCNIKCLHDNKKYIPIFLDSRYPIFNIQITNVYICYIQAASPISGYDLKRPA